MRVNVETPTRPSDASVADGARLFARRKRKLLIVFAVAAIVVAITAGMAAADAYRVSREEHAGRAALKQIATLDGNLHTRALTALRHLERARAIASRSVALGFWARVPLIGRPARWVREASDVTASLGRDAADAIGRIEPELTNAGGPAGRLALLRLLEQELSGLRASVARAHLPSTGWFLPPVDGADRALRGDLARLQSSLTNGIAAVRGLDRLLGGPSTYLVLAANNAEMRAGGMVLQAGVMLSAGGRLAAGHFVSTAALALPKPVAVPPQIGTLYGWLDPGVEWRNVGSSPNFPVTAPMYAAMAERLGVAPVDGVLQIDVVGLRALLDATGPVVVDGIRYDASNVEQLVLHDLYARYRGKQGERRQEFSLLAAAIFKAMNERPVHFEQLARALRVAALGRHILVWSPHAEEEDAWRALGVDGALQRDGLMVTVQNQAGNKLDWFLRPSVDLRIGAHGRARLRITIANPTPSGEPQYVAGDGKLVPPGAYRALVAVYLPGWATDVSMPGRTVAIVGPDGPMRVIGARVDIARGATVQIDVDFTIARGVRRIVILPSGRAQPEPVRVGARLFDDAAMRTVAL